MAKYIASSFSLQMLDVTVVNNIKIEPVDNFPKDCISAVGHADTAAILGVPFNRVNLKISKGDELYVAQLVGGRLPEGSTTLPPDFKMVFLKVTIQ